MNATKWAETHIVGFAAFLDECAQLGSACNLAWDDLAHKRSAQFGFKSVLFCWFMHDLLSHFSSI